MAKKNKRKVKLPDVSIDSWHCYKTCEGKVMANATVSTYTVSRSAGNEKAARAHAQRTMNETVSLYN